MNEGAFQLYRKLKLKGYYPKYVCEVGVYLPEESNILPFINDDIPSILIEADPKTVAILNNYFKKKSNVKIISAAVFDFHGKVQLIRREASTFITELKHSPATVNDNYQVNDNDQFTADAITFDEIDNGEIDLLSIDIEGAEWYVLKHMISRPAIISLETHGKYYTNPFLSEIETWMQNNHYSPWFINKSDTIFVKSSTFRITLKEKIHMKIIKIMLRIIKQKRNIKKILGNY
jgi:FkbM family methyltransferase